MERPPFEALEDLLDLDLGDVLTLLAEIELSVDLNLELLLLLSPSSGLDAVAEGFLSSSDSSSVSGSRREIRPRTSVSDGWSRDLRDLLGRAAVDVDPSLGRSTCRWVAFAIYRSLPHHLRAD